MSAEAFAHPWLGGLFGDAEIAFAWSAEAQLAHMLAFERALAQAQRAVGAVDDAACAAALAAVDGFRPDMAALRAGTARDGVVVPALVAALRAGAAPGAAIHVGATSQDVIDTATAMTVRNVAAIIGGRLLRAAAALEALEARFGDAPIMGRTRMQAALPIRAGHRIAGWRRAVVADAGRLAAAAGRAAALQLGGPVGDRKGLGPHADEIARRMAEALGLRAPDGAWHAARGDLADFAGALSLATGTLGKIGQDVALMAQQGVDEIALGGGGGSSAMPHKANPVLAELLVALARFAAAQVGLMHGALVHEQERSGAAWMVEWLTLPPLCMAAGRAAAAAEELLAGVVRVGAAR